MVLAKFESNGSKLLSTQTSTSTRDHSNSIAVDSSNNFYIVGNTQSNYIDGQKGSGGDDVLLMKYNSSVPSHK